MRAAVVSTYPPRVCGIGTFAADLRATLLGVPGVERVDVVAVVNEPSSPQRRGLLATIAQAVRGDYVRAARTLGRLDVDVVLLQHEYGIFGGPDGEYVLSLAEELAQPLVATLHTVLSRPTRHQLEVLTGLCAEAELVIVMTETARRLLVDCGACPAEKVRVVPHGAPARVITRAGASERFVGLAEGRCVVGWLCTRRRALSALHVRADLGRQGFRDGDRGAAVDDRAAPRDRLRDRGHEPIPTSPTGRASSTGSCSSGGCSSSASPSTSSSTTGSSRSTSSPICSRRPTCS